MRVALLSAEYPPQPGGVGDYTERLGLALMRRGHALTVLTGVAQAGGSSPLPARGIAVWDWRCWREVVAALGELHPEVLHIQYQTGAYGMHPAINLLPWRLRGLPARPRVVVTAHDLLPPYLFPKAGPLREWVTRRLLADADAAVVTNEQDYARLAGGRRAPPGVGRPWPIKRLELIPIGSNISVAPPEGYDRAAWRAGLGAGQDELLVAYFGLISPSKGLDVLLDALARLPDRFRLLVVGGEASAPADRAYAAEVRRRIAGAGLRGRVIVTGHCAAPEVSAHLLAADLAALPFADGASFRRGSLLAVLAHGLPLVTTTTDHRPPTTDERPISHRRSAVSRQPSAPTPRPPVLSSQSPISNLQSPIPIVASLVDGAQALLVPPADAAALAGALDRLAGDAALRARLREGGRRLAARFSWEAIAGRHEALYRELLERQDTGYV